jgi:cation diffusion facilitator family transporter
MSHTTTCDLLGAHTDPPAPAAPQGTAPEQAGWQQRDDHADRHAANRAIAISALGLTVTGLVEITLAVVTGSVALLADALHNLSDVSSSAIVFIGFRVSKRPPSAAYPYGYERAEDLAGLGVALLIWASAALAGYESWHKLTSQQPTTLVWLGILGAVLGIVGNQLVARYKHAVGRRTRSATLLADAKHSWLDALSSAGALVGLVLVALGHRWGDPAAGFAVTLFILHVGWQVTGDLTRRLMDGLDPDDLHAAREAAAGVVGKRVGGVRGRWMGRSLLLEIDVVMDPDQRLAAAEQACRQVERAVLDAVPHARQVRCMPRDHTLDVDGTRGTDVG